MRAFLSIIIPDEIKIQLTAAIKRFAPIAVDVKWSNKDQLHITLAYLGEISPAILPHVTAAANRVCAVLPTFTCRAYGLGFFGTKRNPKTLWAGVDPSSELETLYEGLWKELKKFGFENDESDFRPHITLGRCKESARNHPVIEAMNEDTEINFGEWNVNRITLLESRLSPRGPVYHTLDHIPLA